MTRPVWTWPLVLREILLLDVTWMLYRSLKIRTAQNTCPVCAVARREGDDYLRSAKLLGMSFELADYVTEAAECDDAPGRRELELVCCQKAWPRTVHLPRRDEVLIWREA